MRYYLTIQVCGIRRMIFCYCLLMLLSSRVIWAQKKIWFSEIGVNLSSTQEITYSGNKSERKTAPGYFFTINKGGQKVAFGFHLEYTPVETGIINIDPAKNNTLRLLEYYVGVRYYPLLPTFRFGTFGALRFTAGAFLGGYNYYWKEKDNYSYPTYTHRAWSGIKGTSLFFAGFCFSSFRNTSGLSLRLNYKPVQFTIDDSSLNGFLLNHKLSASASLFIGASINSKKKKK